MKIKQILIAIVIMFSFSGFLINSTVLAADCGKIKTSILPCDKVESGETKAIEDSNLFKNLVIVINVLTGGIGIFAVGGVIYGGILYASAGNSPEQTKKAITAIRNVIIGIAAYALAYTFLNFLIPGGLF